MRITIKQLEALDACPAERAIFAREWPDGADITRENAVRALQLGLNLGWLVCFTCTQAVYSGFAATRACAHRRYKADTASALTEFREAHMQAISDFADTLYRKTQLYIETVECVAGDPARRACAEAVQAQAMKQARHEYQTKYQRTVKAFDVACQPAQVAYLNAYADAAVAALAKSAVRPEEAICE